MLLESTAFNIVPYGPSRDEERPIVVDLFCGMFGWSEGFVAEGWNSIGFDLEDMRGQFGFAPLPHTQLVIQDVRTLHGSQFKSAALIVASPPCQFFSYCAMPWTRAKALAAEVRADPTRLAKELELFNACFRIQREACEASGRHIPLIVENVRGAQPWVGRARWSFGSFYLWGDVPALMPPSSAIKGYPRANEPHAIKNQGGSWFAVAHNTTSGKGQNPDGRKLPAFRPSQGSGQAFDGSGRSFQSASVEGVKAIQDGSGSYGGSFGWDDTPLRRGNSKSPARKFASAMIAKIPFVLSQHIARTLHPQRKAA